MATRARARWSGGWWLALALALAACGGGEPEEAPEEEEERAEDAAVEAAPAAPHASAAPAAPAPASSSGDGERGLSALEGRAERLVRLAREPLSADSGVQVTVLSMSLEEAPYRSGAGKREVGVSLKLAGVVYNQTGHTLSEGTVVGVLALGFEEEEVRVRLSPDALKVAVQPELPWREGESRLFEVETEAFPRVMLEYAPTWVEATLVASLRDPVGFELAAPIWRAKPSWLAARVAPVKGEAQVFQADPLMVGPRRKSAGKLRSGEVVKLLYQSGGHFRVQASEGVGWVEAKALVVKQLEALYEGAAPPGGSRTASNPEGALRVHGVTTLDQAPGGLKLLPGERALRVEVELTNTGDKELRCSEVFADFGPNTQRGPLKGSEVLEGALACEKDKLPPGETIRGALTWARGRYELPVVIGWTTRSGVLSVDVYDPADVAAWRR